MAVASVLIMPAIWKRKLAHNVFFVSVEPAQLSGFFFDFFDYLRKITIFKLLFDYWNISPMLLFTR
mgnify:CR=1 FL=1